MLPLTTTGSGLAAPERAVAGMERQGAQWCVLLPDDEVVVEPAPEFVGLAVDVTG
jgi:hypothetical protein